MANPSLEAIAQNHEYLAVEKSLSCAFQDVPPTPILCQTQVSLAEEKTTVWQFFGHNKIKNISINH